ncbi:MAG TPA: hypothetical protein VGL78_15070 [Solirubrobacteraceae bacterium]|jgi:hypothetical protein
MVEQSAGLHAESFCEAQDRLQARLTEAALETPDRRWVDAGPVGELVLGELDPAVLADARGEALRRAGFDEVGALAEGAASVVVATSEGREQRFLDTEVVAIYW